VPYSQADVTRAGAVLGWRTETPLEEGLVRTVAWFTGE
jgi:nucleoside-diphosphate-sugar epimerase